MPIKWLTIDQVSEHFQFSEAKIYKLCQRGKMPVYKIGGQWRFDLNEIDAWAKQNLFKKKTKK